ncbi:hypothetical protein CBS101457_005045 [Exobasidium rhododendri]|nr:hypothetical protein CBS101457_005045 [Exobasidium rhododendri]
MSNPGVTLYSLFYNQLAERGDQPILGIPSILSTDQKSSSGIKIKYEVITYRQLYALVLALAHDLVESGILSTPQHRKDTSTSGKPPQITAALVAPSHGLSYIVHELCLMHLGYCCALISPNNSQEAMEHLFDDMDVSIVFCDKTIEEKARGCKNAPSTIKLLDEQLDLPDFSSLSITELERKYSSSSSSSSSPVLPIVTFEDHAIAYKTHSSGSTSYPKMIAIPHTAAISTVTINMGFPAMTTLPLFHNHGNEAMWRGFASGLCIYIYPMSRLPMTAQGISAALDATSTTSNAAAVQHLYTVPYTLELFSHSSASDYLESIKALDLVTFAGSPCSDEVGDTIIRHDVKLAALLGMTETGGIMTSVRDFDNDKEWQYMRPIPARRKWMRWDAVDEQRRLYELVLLPGWPGLALSNNPDGSFSTRDMYHQHEHIEGAYKHQGRLDDTLVHSSGEKTNPVPIEGMLRAADENITQVLVFGAGRHLPGAIVIVPEEFAGEDRSRTVREKVDEMLMNVNERVPSHSRLLPELVDIQSEEVIKLPKTDKGSLIRARAYKDETIAALIDDIYRRFDKGQAQFASADEGVADVRTEEKAVNCVSEAVKKVMPDVDDKDIDESTTFTEMGIDSMQAQRLRSLLSSKLGPSTKEEDKLPWNVVLEAHSVGELATVMRRKSIEAAGEDGGDAHREEEEDDALKQAEAMHSLVEKYSQQIVSRRESVGGQVAHRTTLQGSTVLLTGSTGFLGSNVLRKLKDEGVRKVYALVRAKSNDEAQARVKEALLKRKLEGDTQSTLTGHADDETEVVALAADFEKASFGLDNDTYHQMQSEVQHVIHIAWTVNFLWPIKAYEAQLETLTRLLNFCSSSTSQPSPPSFSFASSISTVLNMRPETRIPEGPTSDPSNALDMGYAKSKWVAEALCEEASKKISGLQVNIIRIGQMSAHSSTGIWNEVELWPLLLRGSQEIGSLADPVRWLPVDTAADEVVQIMRAEETVGQARIVNLVHPFLTPWSVVCQGLEDAGMKLPLIDPPVWLEEMKKASTQPSHDSNPALKLMHVWEQRFASSSGNSSVSSADSSSSSDEKEAENTNYVEDSRDFETGFIASKQPAQSNILSGPLSRAYVKKMAQAFGESGFLTLSS